MLASLLGFPKQAEILVIVFLGICFLSLDFSLFHLHEDLSEIWHLQLQTSKCLEVPLKYVITSCVLIRTFTLHLFLAFHVVMLWPAIFEEKASLMIPWLLLGAFRCLVLSFITFSIGLLVCHKEKGLSPICFYFLLVQIIQHAPSVYAWISVYSFYKQISASQPSVLSQEDQKALSEFIAKPRSHSYSGYSKKRCFSDENILNGQESFSSSIEGDFAESTMDKIMGTLNISKEDVLRASAKKDNYANFLLEISLDDLEQISASRVNLAKGHCSHCGYFDRRPSDRTLLTEIEMGNVNLDGEDLENLGRTMTEFNPDEFLQNFLMKKNTSRNFGCQVSMLKRGFFEKSKIQVAKKLLFLRNFGLFQTN